MTLKYLPILIQGTTNNNIHDDVSLYVLISIIIVFVVYIIWTIYDYNRSY